MRRDECGSGFAGFVAGAVIGGAVGAGLALLFAPRSGEETRKIISKKAQEFGDEFDEFKKDIGPKIQKAKDELAQKLAPKTKTSKTK